MQAVPSVLRLLGERIDDSVEYLRLRLWGKEVEMTLLSSPDRDSGD
jgi:hypothetical protein